MKPTAAALVALLVALPAAAEEELYIYNWSDYTAPDLVAKFERDTGIKVRVDTYDSNETLLAKLKSGSSGYDIAVVTSDFLPVFAAQMLIEPIDGPSLPGYANIAARWRSPPWDPDNQYTVPWVWGVTAFSVNTKEVKGPYDSLKLLFEPPPELAGKIGMLGSPSEDIALAEAYLGVPPCQTDTHAMKKVQDLLLEQADSVKVYNSDGVIERQASGETWVSMEWNGAAMRSRLLNPAIRFVYPKEGAVVWLDNVVIPRGALHPANAKKFMAFLLQPENIALQTNFTKYLNAIVGSEQYFDESVKAAPEMNVPPDERLVVTPACPEPAIRLMDRVWTRLKR